jgi:hypothetical protein
MKPANDITCTDSGYKAAQKIQKSQKSDLRKIAFILNALRSAQGHMSSFEQRGKNVQNTRAA